MGQTLSEPIVTKHTTQESSDKLFYGASAMQGWRLTMEDAHTTLLKLDDTNLSFFGVYDGHGGKNVAEYTGRQMHNKVRKSPFFDKKDYKEALRDAFMSLDKEINNDKAFASDPSGCTAVTALITPDKRIFVANAGDSRSVISVGGKNKPLSYDHKPTNQSESQRIVNAGGFVEYGRVNGNLALSRAIGDFEFKKNTQLPAEEQVVTCNPDIIEHKITDEDEFFVLACDGIWDCMSNQQVVDFIRTKIVEETPIEKICETIMDHCLSSNNDNASVGYDNMSIVIVGILNGKTEKEWYQWVGSRAGAEAKKHFVSNDHSKDSDVAKESVAEKPIEVKVTARDVEAMTKKDYK
ncbi:phosphatase 2C-like domain-containing protein [Phycomyces nitens]|nr:phosphatase 2C-like domain-containing protein [Phycomyces nitens]